MPVVQEGIAGVVLVGVGDSVAFFFGGMWIVAVGGHIYDMCSSDKNNLNVCEINDCGSLHPSDMETNWNLLSN